MCKPGLFGVMVATHLHAVYQTCSVFFFFYGEPLALYQQTNQYQKQNLNILGNEILKNQHSNAFFNSL